MELLGSPGRTGPLWQPAEDMFGRTRFARAQWVGFYILQKTAAQGLVDTRSFGSNHTIWSDVRFRIYGLRISLLSAPLW